MDNQPILMAAGGMVIGVLVAVAISDARVNTKVSTALERAGTTTSTAVADATEALSAQVAELEARLGAGASAASEAAEARVAALEAEINAQLAALSDTAATRASELEAALAELAAMRETAPPAATAPAVTASLPSLSARSVGETAIFADGAVRAFVSAFDPAANAATLNINGESVALGVGAAAPVSLDSGDCVVSVVGVSAAGVEIGSDCGAGGMTAAEVPPAPEDGYTPGSVALLADGAVRVFVSGLAQDGSAARIAVNGIDTQVVASGASIDVTAGDQSCTLTVTGVGNGLVGLESACN